ncbi:MAG TPA: zf-HC2 domain-containing protein [Steroidobacter sp.]
MIRVPGWHDTHRECWELLPWIANERASSEDRAKVEEHLRECERCRNELEAQRRLRDAIRSGEPILLAPQASFQKLMRRIDGFESGEIERPRATPLKSAHRPRKARPVSWLGIAAAVQALAIAALFGALWWQAEQSLTAPRYVTLTSRPAVAPGPVIRAVFADDARLEEINELLRSVGAQIVSGPSIAGVYTVALPAGRSKPEEIEAAAAALRAHERVRFAEVALVEEPSR